MNLKSKCWFNVFKFNTVIELCPCSTEFGSARLWLVICIFPDRNSAIPAKRKQNRIKVGVDVNVRLEKEATTTDIKSISLDAVILATSDVPFIPEIDSNNVATTE